LMKKMRWRLRIKFFTLRNILLILGCRLWRS